ncbi:unnamed protein product [Spirodela intermedia]|uniref:Uncharacterized protein n=1 Tax=Spirodela intermedia TaxID=51605 RepID=A0A7I8IIP0_SPIIN|nr:unnamed protein product [Spirodela intermedia]CAA6657734.1 unnamed protein product [Spirodela intermedia]
MQKKKNDPTNLCEKNGNVQYHRM